MTDSTESMVREDGTYPVEPLRRDTIVASVVQTHVNGVNGRHEQDRMALIAFADGVQVDNEAITPSISRYRFHLTIALNSK